MSVRMSISWPDGSKNRAEVVVSILVGIWTRDDPHHLLPRPVVEAKIVDLVLHRRTIVEMSIGAFCLTLSHEIVGVDTVDIAAGFATISPPCVSVVFARPKMVERLVLGVVTAIFGRLLLDDWRDLTTKSWIVTFPVPKQW